jgi:hypothetical protein
MPDWLVPTLKWGGIILAIVSAIALIYVQMAAPPPGPETGEAVSEAPTTLSDGSCPLRRHTTYRGPDSHCGHARGLIAETGVTRCSTSSSNSAT